MSEETADGGRRNVQDIGRMTPEGKRLMDELSARRRPGETVRDVERRLSREKDEA